MASYKICGFVMSRSKLLFKNIAACNRIPSKLRPKLLFSFDVASCSCLSFQKPGISFVTRKDNDFKKPKLITKTSLFRGSEKCFSKFTDAKCWKCDQYLVVKDFACTACGALQEPGRKLQYFELFGFSQSFDINVEELSKKFKKLQAIFHPDKYAGKTKAEKDISETYSKLVNKAYSTLKDPLQRGLYILALQKYPDCNAPLDQEFLRAVMSKNEELDCLNSEDGLEKFKTRINAESEKYLTAIKRAFTSGNLDEAKLNLSKLTYFDSMNKRVKEKINKLQEKKSL